MTENELGYVRSSTEHYITTIEFFHPKSNSMPSSLLSVLVQHLHRASSPDIKVIVLKSTGTGAFCAGASFDELMAVSNEEEGFHFFMGFANVINAIRKIEKLVIVRVQGKCVGGGVGIAAAADYAIAYEPAEVKLSELALGIGPFVIGPAVERKIGVSAYSQLAIDAELWRSSQWAKTKALYAEVHPTIESMDESIDRLSASLSHYDPVAMAEMKKVFWSGSANWDQLLEERARLSGQLILSSYAKAAIQKIKSKS